MKADINTLAAVMYDAAIGKIAGSKNVSYLPFDSLGYQGQIPFKAAAINFLDQEFRIPDAKIEIF